MSSDSAHGYPTPLQSLVSSRAGRGHLREVYERAEDSFLLVDISGWTFSSIAPCNNVSLQPVNISLGNVKCLLPRLSGKVDVLLFNPPYVVTPSEEVHGYRGCLGRGGEVTDTFLSVVAQLLSSKGLFYLITIADNDPGELPDAWAIIFSAGNTLDNKYSRLCFPFLTTGDYPFTGRVV
uniref:N-6 adenine-specific DNA methyltransferase 1 n=1 Tax=Sander lucioperca TaxID=283035 RepID=A0A8C9XV34_SANLU